MCTLKFLGGRNTMKKSIINFINENKEFIMEKLTFAAEESVSIGYDIQEKVSVVLYENFELGVIKHPSSYWYPTNIIYVLASFECESYIVDYDDIISFLGSEKSKEFYQFLIDKGKNLIELDKDEEISKNDLLFEIVNYIEENDSILNYFQMFNAKLFNEYIENIKNNIDCYEMVLNAYDHIMDNLYVLEE